MGHAIGGSTVTRRPAEILINAGHDDVDAQSEWRRGRAVMTDSGTKFIPTRVKGIGCVGVETLRRWSRKVTGSKKIGNVHLGSAGIEAVQRLRR